MDLKSIVFSERMKFLFVIILISSYLSLSWEYPYDVLNTSEPSHLLFSLYSMPHNLLTKNVDPNIVYLRKKIPPVEYVKFDPLVSSPKYLYLKMAGIQHAYVHGLCSPLLSICKRFLNYIFVSIDLCNVAEHPLLKHDNDILSTKQYDNLNCLWNVNFSDIGTSNKTKKFIETKVTAMKLQGFNL